MPPYQIRRAFCRLLDSYSDAKGQEARNHARLIVEMMSKFPWLNKQVSSGVLARILASSGYLPAARRAA
jgi:hypothetical protein